MSEAEIRALAEEAYVFGYPLVLMDASRERENRFRHGRELPDFTFTDLAGPNVDVLFSRAWLDLSKDPVVFSLPAANFHYYLISIVSAWGEIFTSLSPRTSTTAKAEFAIVGPGWSGKLPDGFRRVDAPTSMVWMIGRIQTDGKADEAAVHKMQDEYKLTPLSEWGQAKETPSNGDAPAKKKAVDVVAKMKASVFFSKLAELMAANPPAPADAPMVDKLARLGIVPGRTFDASLLGPKAGKTFQQGANAGLAKLIAEAKAKTGKLENGWTTSMDLGSYGTRYLFRAAMAWLQLGAELPNDLLYLEARVDAEGKPLSGAQRYVLHFDAGQFPPAMGLWSVTAYGPRQSFAAKAAKWPAVGDRDPPKANEDGSLDLYIQKDSPGADKEPNWIPAPAKSFTLVLRLYYPMQKMLDGTWSPPAVQRMP